MSQHHNTTSDFTGSHILVSGEGDNEYIRETAWFWHQRGHQIYAGRGDRRGAPLRVVRAQPLQIQFIQDGDEEFAGPSPAFQERRQPRLGANAVAVAVAPTPAPAPVLPCPTVLQLLDEYPVSRTRDDETVSEPGRGRPIWIVEYNEEAKARRAVWRRKHRGGKKERTRRDRVTGKFFNIKKKDEGEEGWEEGEEGCEEGVRAICVDWWVEFV